jgi:hypothetical protein
MPEFAFVEFPVGLLLFFLCVVAFFFLVVKELKMPPEFYEQEKLRKKLQAELKKQGHYSS